MPLIMDGYLSDLYVLFDLMEIPFNIDGYLINLPVLLVLYSDDNAFGCRWFGGFF